MRFTGVSAVAAAIAVVKAVTACYALLSNGSELLLSKKYKKVKNGGREIERRGKLEIIERENREDEEHVIDLLKL